MSPLRTLRPSLVSCLVLALGCTAPPRGGGGGGPDDGCVPGQSVQCFCSNGAAGAQVCRDDRTFDACSCSETPDGGSEPDGGGKPDAGDPRTDCERMCDNVYECDFSFTKGGNPISREGCVQLCDVGDFSAAQQSCFTDAPCEEDEINRCFDPDQPLCPEDAACGSRECGPDPVCGTSCGVCNEGFACNAQGACLPAKGWTFESIVVETPRKLAFAVDPDGTASVAMLFEDGDLLYARQDEVDWLSSTIETIGLRSLALHQKVLLQMDGQKRPHLVYLDDARNQLRYAWRAAGSTNWTLEAVDPTQGRGDGAALVLDEDDVPHVAYSGSNAIWYATRASNGTWTQEQVMAPDTFGFVGSFLDLALDPDGRPAVVYGSGNNLVYSVRVDGDWTLETIVAPGQYEGFHFISLMIDDAGTPHVSFQAYTSRKMRYATRGTSGWIVEDFASTNSSNAYNDLLVDGSGNIHVVYVDPGTSHLKHATRGSSGWSLQNVDTTFGVGSEIVLAPSPGGNPWLGYTIYRNPAGVRIGRFYP